MTSKKKSKTKIKKEIEVFVSFLISIFFSKEILLRELTVNSEINITINGTGNQYILSSSFQSIPNKIIVNGITQNSTNRYIQNLQENINNISMIWNYKLTNCQGMFSGLSNIIKIDMTNFDISSVTDMSYMFSGCSSLKYLYINDLDTSSVTLINNMFSGCRSLVFLDLRNFDISSVSCVCGLFNGCSSLISLNINNFVETTKMDNQCGLGNTFNGLNPNLNYCVNSLKAKRISSSLSKFKYNCNNICFPDELNKYSYTYKNECLEFCPKETYISSNNSYLCVDYCDNFYDYNRKNCINEIPEGFF